MTSASVASNDIAIIGMAAHLPGAADVAEFWANLRAGISAIRRLTPEELAASGESPARLRAPNYVPAAAPLAGFDHFDADFFGLSPKEAAIMDPQHRQFLEVAWHALEDAGHLPEGFPGRIGVFGGCGMGAYFTFNLCSNPDLVADTGLFLLRHTGNDKDFLTTRVSHILDLKGPSVGVQTACSTSLVAVHVAAQSLLNGECDMALAGGVTIELPQNRGYLYHEGEVLSPDGECHAFDHRAQGTVFGSGAGCVVLRRLDDALADGDHIWAVVKGTAVNNDGADKAGYLAPSVDGQARAVAEALAVADVGADTIGYVECHGTGTYLGDPIEVAALTQAFRETTDAVGRTRIGSAKPGIGHLDTAAGVASLIKTALALHHGEIPPSLGYEAPNPVIDFDTSPFVVNDRLAPFPELGAPRRAGVNSLGVGGTNAHAVLEAAPERAVAEPADFPFLPLVLSARNPAALDAAAARLAAHLRAHPEQDFADIAHTLKHGRRRFEHHRVLVATDHAEAAALLETGDRHRVHTHRRLEGRPEVVFMFPGGGAQYAGMARDLYETEPVFRDWMDRGIAHLQPRHAVDLRAVWLPDGDPAAADTALQQPSVQLPLIMMVEYALAQLWISWGVQPARLIGHSMGENTAAALAGVMTFEDCLDLVHLRGQLFDTIAPGGMLSVPLAADDLAADLGADLDIAVVNAPDLCVVSGPQAALDALSARLAARGVEAQRIAIDIAAHSRMLAPILHRFGDHLRGMTLAPPQIPIISNRTGAELTAAQATNPDYWVQHLRGTVQFAAGIATLAGPNRVFLEVGPGRALASLAQANGVPANQVLATLRHPDHAIADDVHFIGTMARLWALGVATDWAPLWGEARRHRVPLPTYPFQRQRYFIEPGAPATVTADPLPERVADMADWGWQPHWRPTAAGVEAADLAEQPARNWLLFADEGGLAAKVATRLRDAGHRVAMVTAGDRFAVLGPDAYSLAPEAGREGYDRLLAQLAADGALPDRIGHFWLVTERPRFRPGSSFFHRNLEQGFWSLFHLGQALIAIDPEQPIHLTTFTTGAVQVHAEPLQQPEKATIAGLLRVLPREMPGLTAGSCDLELNAPDLSDLVIEELLAPPANRSAALRGARRYELSHRPLPLPPVATADLPQGAGVLITGGFGGIGLTLAARLARDHGARIALLGRHPLPPRADWPAELARNPAGPVARRIRAVEQLESLGAEVIALHGDVANIAEMQAAKAAALAAFGRLDVLIHAAGMVADAPLAAKDDAQVEAVFAPKIHGTQVLDQLFPDGELGLIVAFASTSTVTAPAGQVDYVAANEYLNAWAAARAGGKTRVVALNWGIWADTGMAATAVRGAPTTPAVPAGVPMLDTAGFDAEGRHILAAEWDSDRWWLDGHRTAAGDALIPGTGYLDLVAQARAATGQPGGFEIRDLMFLRPLAMVAGQPRQVRLRLDAGDGGFEIRSDVVLDGRAGFQLNAQGSIAPLTAAPGRIDLAAIAARLGPATTGTGLTSPQEAHLNFGPRWRVLSSTALGAGEGLAHLHLPRNFHGDLTAGHLIHPALMDLATGWAMGLIAGYRPTNLWVPVGYDRIVVHAPLPAEIHSWVRNADDNRADRPEARFDITITDAAGTILIEVTGFRLHRLDGPLQLTARPSPAEVEFSATVTARSPAEERLHHNLSQGIRADEGATAFVRALATGVSPVIVSSLPLPDLVAQAGITDTAPAAGQAFARPELDSAFLAPRNPIEAELATLWQDLLGLEQVGVADSFFDLGGHSLIAVRLFAQIRRKWAVDFPISILFEAPTIADCAALIAGRIGPQDDTATATTAVVPLRRFTHLVPMATGAERPFFVVAGMFGNVLNLRHLGQLLGADRPVYGLQARGLYGDQEPHGDFVTAATDYIAEMRQVQDGGPWLLGGFSGGGLIAWEIARQLRAAGDEVATLVLLDTPLPLLPELSRGDKALIKLAELRRKGPAYLGEWWRARREWQAAQAAGPAAAGAHQLHNAAIEAAFRAALPIYDLQPWDGPVTLYRPPLDRYWRVSGGQWVGRNKQFIYPDNRWGPYAPRLQVIEVPGDHDSMVLEPNVRVLVAHMRGVLAAADSAPVLRAAE